MKQQLFQYAVILHEFEEITGTETSSVPKYKSSRMIIEPKYILAKDQKEILFKVTREIPEEFASNPDNIEILVRNF